MSYVILILGLSLPVIGFIINLLFEYNTSKPTGVDMELIAEVDLPKSSTKSKTSASNNNAVGNVDPDTGVTLEPSGRVFSHNLRY